MRDTRRGFLVGRRALGASCGALLAVAALLGGPGRIDAQAAPPPRPPAPAPAPVAAVAPTGVSPGFMGILVGMSVDEVKEQLAKEPLFLYRGDKDLSLIPASRQLLIDVPGRTFVERGSFQFHDGKLLVMIVVLSRELVSYYEVYTRLLTRYGAVSSLDPSSAVWELPGVRLSLEKPVVLKYVDSATFAALKGKSEVGTDWETETRRQFLEKL